MRQPLHVEVAAEAQGLGNRLVASHAEHRELHRDEPLKLKFFQPGKGSDADDEAWRAIQIRDPDAGARSDPDSAGRVDAELVREVCDPGVELRFVEHVDAHAVRLSLAVTREQGPPHPAADGGGDRERGHENPQRGEANGGGSRAGGVGEDEGEQQGGRTQHEPGGRQLLAAPPYLSLVVAGRR